MNESSPTPQPYDHRLRLAEVVGDSRAALAERDTVVSTPAYLGRLEALLAMMAATAEHMLEQAASLNGAVPNLAETSDTLAGKVDDLGGRDLHWLLMQLAYGSPGRQQVLSDLLDALALWKRDNPQHRQPK